MNDRLKALADAGVSIWLDDLSRERLTSGSLADLIADKHVGRGDHQPDDLRQGHLRRRRVRRAGTGWPRRASPSTRRSGCITTDDVRDAADLFKPVVRRHRRVRTAGSRSRSSRAWPATPRRRSPQAKELWEIVDRENVFDQDPGHQGGPAGDHRDARPPGISVNVTLIFSLERYKAVVDAFLTGLEQAVENGHDVTKLASVASFFVSRVDTEVDKRLDAIGTDEAQGAEGQGRDRQRPARVRGVRGDLRLRPLARARDRRRQAAAAAVGVDRRQGPGVLADTLYVDNLVTRGVVNTMPEATIKAIAEHGEITGDTVRGDYDGRPQGDRRPGEARHLVRRGRAGARGRGRRRSSTPPGRSCRTPSPRL